jgi:hypothetical protein
LCEHEEHHRHHEQGDECCEGRHGPYGEHHRHHGPGGEGHRGCGDWGHGPAFRRRFQTREEKIARLEQYLKDLLAEAKAVEERLAELRG